MALVVGFESFAGETPAVFVDGGAVGAAAFCASSAVCVVAGVCEGVVSRAVAGEAVDCCADADAAVASCAAACEGVAGGAAVVAGAASRLASATTGCGSAGVTAFRSAVDAVALRPSAS